MRKKRLPSIEARTCLRCGHGPYYPRNPNAVNCPACKRPYDTKRVRKPGGGRKAAA